jgi:hypothetical protein
MFKILKFLKVLKITICFGQYGHPQVLKSSGGNFCYSAIIACALPIRTCVYNMREDKSSDSQPVLFECDVMRLRGSVFTEL